MRKSALPSLLLGVVIFSVTLQSCKDDVHLLTPPPIPDQSFVEEFDTLSAAHSRGWRWSNRSVPVGPSEWTQVPGPAAGMAPYSSMGTNQGAAYSNRFVTALSGTRIISNWLISPSVIMQNGDKIIFYTKGQLAPAAGTNPRRDFKTRLQVRINPDNDQITIGDGDNAGNFRRLLLDINPTEKENLGGNVVDAYPSGWTRFEATIDSLPKPVRGRFALRYYLHGTGTTQLGNGIGIDSLAYISNKK